MNYPELTKQKLNVASLDYVEVYRHSLKVIQTSSRTVMALSIVIQITILKNITSEIRLAAIYHSVIQICVLQQNRDKALVLLQFIMWVNPTETGGCPLKSISPVFPTENSTVWDFLNLKIGHPSRKHPYPHNKLYFNLANTSPNST